VQADEPLEISVSAERTDRSLLSRITGALRLTSNNALDVNWLEAAETAAPDMMPRYLSVDFAGLGAGVYRLHVRVERADGTIAMSGRFITLP
jgi:hypothetical protein